MDSISFRPSYRRLRAASEALGRYVDSLGPELGPGIVELLRRVRDTPGELVEGVYSCSVRATHWRTAVGVALDSKRATMLARYRISSVRTISFHDVRQLAEGTRS